MGRYIKNKALIENAYAAQLPIGNSLLEPESVVDGLVRFNPDNNTIEYYANNQWNKVSKVGVVDIVKDTFYTDGTTANFGPLIKSYSAGRETDVLVFIGNIFQNPGVAYELHGDVIAFTSVPNANETVVVLHNLNSTNAV